MTTYEALKPLVPGKPVEIFERNEQGHLVGAWIGYWSFNKGTVALYPNVRNRAVNWPGGRVPSQRCIVSDRAITVRSSALNGAAAAKKTEPEKAQSVSSQTGRAMKELVGQEKIKI